VPVTLWKSSPQKPEEKCKSSYRRVLTNLRFESIVKEVPRGLRNSKPPGT